MSARHRAGYPADGPSSSLNYPSAPRHRLEGPEAPALVTVAELEELLKPCGSSQPWGR